MNESRIQAMRNCFSRAGLRHPRFSFGLSTLFAAFVPIALLCAWLGPLTLVAPGQQIFGYFFSARTVYAPQYSDVGWLGLRTGMSRDDVLQHLGEPLHKGAHGHVEVWEYSQSTTTENYQLRQVHFYDGALWRTLSDLYID